MRRQETLEKILLTPFWRKDKDLLLICKNANNSSNPKKCRQFVGDNMPFSQTAYCSSDGFFLWNLNYIIGSRLFIFR
jgi:hypothetical protein